MKHTSKEKSPVDKVIDARGDLLMKSPFYALVAMKQKIIEDRSIETCYVDGVHLGFNPLFMSMITSNERIGVWVHEILHLIFMHHLRRGDRYPELWNEACDYAINPLVLRAGFKMPEGYLYDARFADKTAEEIYDILLRERQQEKQQKQENQDNRENHDSQESQSSDKGDDQSQGDSDQSQDDESDQGTQSDDRDQKQDGNQGQKSEQDPNGQGKNTDESQNDKSGEISDQSQGDSQGKNDQDSQDQQDGQESGYSQDTGDDDSDSGKSDGSGSSDDGQDQSGQDNYSNQGDSTDSGTTCGSGSPADSGQGKSDTGSSRPLPWGEVRDYPGETGKATDDERKFHERDLLMSMAEAARTAEKIGNMPGYLKTVIKDMLEPKMSWKQVLARFLDQSFERGLDWSKPNRRFVGSGIYLPHTSRPHLGEVLLVFDTSVSIDLRQMVIMATEVQELVSEFDIEVVVLYADTEVRGSEVITKDDIPVELHPLGGGGTAFSPTFKYIKEHEDEYDPLCIIYMTDGQCYDYPEKEPDVPVLWVITNWEEFKRLRVHYPQINPPWGDIVPYEE